MVTSQSAMNWWRRPSRFHPASEPTCKTTPGRTGRGFASEYRREGLELRGDVMEGRAEVGPDQLECGNRGNRDQCGDQAVFDGRRAVVVFQKPRQSGKHAIPS